jgi:argininosuccinate lyase
VEYPPGHAVLDSSAYRHVVRIAAAGADPDTVAARIVADLGPNRFDAMLCMHDDAVRVGARVAALLDLPFATPATADRTVNKHLMRAALGKLNTVPYRFCASAETIEDAATAMGPPVVVKPDSGRASRGVALLDTTDELASYVRRVRDLGLPDGPLLVERRVRGQEFSVECLSRDGRHEWLGLTRKLTVGAIEIGHVQPGLPEDDPRCPSIFAYVGKVLDRLGIHDGLSHTEVILEEPGEREGGGAPVHLVETHLRGGGDHILDLCRLRSGADPAARYVSGLLGGDDADVRRSAPVGAAASRFLLPTRSGTVLAVDGLEEARRCEGVQFVEPLVGPGDRVEERVTSSYGRVAAAVAVGDTPGEAMGRAEAALDRLTFKIGSDS